MIRIVSDKSPRAARRGFTLVELLVVIGIIALLIGILLPTLNRARSAAATVACLSNQRQIGTGFVFYQNDWGGALPAFEVLNQPEGPAGRFWAWKLAEPGYIPLEPSNSPEDSDFDTVFTCPAGSLELRPLDQRFDPPENQTDTFGAMRFTFEVPGPAYDPADDSTLQHVSINYAVNGTWAADTGPAWWSDVIGQDDPYQDWFPMNYVNHNRDPNQPYGRSDWHKITNIEEPTRVGLMFDGPFLLAQEITMMNMRHGDTDALNWVFADGHAATIRQSELPNDDPRSANYWQRLLPTATSSTAVLYNMDLLNSDDFAVKFTMKPIFNPWQ
jgi:prepilin-type N-terminal cleavage/methylation domain-containing protein/prepilin-type processing-associated H-X9-DG protein